VSLKHCQKHRTATVLLVGTVVVTFLPPICAGVAHNYWVNLLMNFGKLDCLRVFKKIFTAVMWCNSRKNFVKSLKIICLWRSKITSMFFVSYCFRVQGEIVKNSERVSSTVFEALLATPHCLFATVLLVGTERFIFLSTQVCTRC
jgi:hypothetical protein